MGKAPAMAECLFCFSLPCQCARIARKAAQPSSRRTKILDDAEELAKPKSPPAATEQAPKAQSRRFSALDAMRAASAEQPPVLRTPAPVAPARAPLRARNAPAVPITPAIPPDPVERESAQFVGDLGIMDYAEHLLRVGLGAVPVDQKYSNGALETRARRIRERLKHVD